jgi:hypothetical protein
VSKAVCANADVVGELLLVRVKLVVNDGLVRKTAAPVPVSSLRTPVRLAEEPSGAVDVDQRKISISRRCGYLFTNGHIDIEGLAPWLCRRNWSHCPSGVFLFMDHRNETALCCSQRSQLSEEIAAC